MSLSEVKYLCQKTLSLLKNSHLSTNTSTYQNTFSSANESVDPWQNHKRFLADFARVIAVTINLDISNNLSQGMPLLVIYSTC